MSLFPLGQVVASPGAVRRLSQSELSTVLSRHASGDWGGAPEGLRTNNAGALRSNGPLLSVYNLGPGRVVMVQTEGDRRASFVRIEDEDGSTWEQGKKAFVRELFNWRRWLEIISSTL